MNKIDELKEIVKKNKKKIILTEPNDERILSSAIVCIEEDLVDIIFLGQKEEIINKYPILDKAEWINPKESNLLDLYIDKLYELRKEKGLTKEESRNLLLNNYMYFACMLLLDKKADGIVSGVSHSSSDTLRPALQIIKGKQKLVSSFFIMDTNNKELGEEGLFIFADCGLIQNPNSNELSIIARESINSFRSLISNNPRLAFLSHSTYGSSKHEMIDKVKEATLLTKQSNPNDLIDGELQLDAAIIKEVAKIKAPGSILEGKANILIFPDIDSGNIGYKLVERFGNAKAYGPLTQGLNYPVNDLSRGSTVEDIVGVIVITALQSIKNML